MQWYKFSVYINQVPFLLVQKTISGVDYAGQL